MIGLKAGPFWSTIAVDFRLQFRNGFYYAVAVVVVFAVIVLSWLSDESVAWLMPVILLGNFLVNGMLFMAGLVMLERDQGSLQALMVTPLGIAAYLLSKLLSLSTLSLIESLALIWLLGVPLVSPLALILGIVFGTVILALAGLALATRYPTVNALLLPVCAWGTALLLPIISYFDLAGLSLNSFDWMFLHPMQPAMMLLTGGFTELSWWQWGYALGAGLIVIGVLLRTCWRGLEALAVEA